MAFLVGANIVIDNSANIIIGSGASNPASPAAGTIWFNTTLGRLVGWNGSVWIDLTVS
jgi:hypothetical protein